MKKLLSLAIEVLFMLGTLAVPASAQSVTLTGTLRASNGLPSSNYSIAFTPTQWAFIAGTGVQVNTTTYCATSTDGAVVGIGNPLTASVVTPQYTGTLAAGNYFIEYTFYSGSTETLPSPESTAQLTATGELLVAPPVSGVPPTATGMRVYIGTTSGGETLQGSTTGSGNYTQSTPLVAGSSPPGTNNTVCTQTANDAMWPTGTGYTVSVTDPSGNTLPGYPMVWQLLGPNSTINLANGLPYYNGVVTYPVPLLASPLNHANQSISGPLSLTGYNLVNVGKLGAGTGTPGWGVDAEGSGNNGRINAANGYLTGGNGGTSGQGLCSDGTAADMWCAFITAAQLPTVYYQTVEDSSGATYTQRPVIRFNDPAFAVADSLAPEFTGVSLNKAGTDAKLLTTAVNSTINDFACGDANGGVAWSASPCTGTFPAVDKTWAAQTLCTPATSTDATCTGTFTYPASFAFADTGYGLWIQGLSSTGAGIYAVVTAKTTTGFSYAVWCTFGCSAYGTLTFDIRGTHP